MKLARLAGFTLMEVIVASMLGMVVVLGAMRFDVMRVRVEQEIRQRSGVAAVAERDASLAALQLSNDLTRADRIRVITDGIPGDPIGSLPGGADVQLRIPELDTDCPALSAACPVVCAGCTGEVPPSCCVEIPGNSRWAQYRRDAATNTLVHYRDVAGAGCVASRQVAARQIASLTFQFRDRAPAPPGGEPFDNGPEDNNMVEFAMVWDDAGPPPRSHAFRGEVAMRATPHSDVEAGCGGASGPCDSGTGLVPLGVNPPPVLCAN